MDQNNVKKDDNLDIEIIEDFEINDEKQIIKPTDGVSEKDIGINRVEPRLSNPVSSPTGPGVQTTPQPSPNRQPGVQATPQPVPNRQPGVQAIPQPAPNRQPGVQATPQPAPNRQPGVQATPQPAPNRQPGVQTTPQPVSNRQPGVQTTPQSTQNTNPNVQPVLRPVEGIPELDKTLNSESIQTNQPIKPSKEKKKNLFFRILLLLIILAVIAFSVFYLYESNPKRLLVKGMEEIATKFEYLSEPLKGSNVNIGGKKTITGNVALNLKLNSIDEFGIENMIGDYQKIVDNINNTSINYNYQKDLDNQKILLNILGNLNGAELFNIKLLNSDGKQYVFLKDILNKYIELGAFSSVGNFDTKKTFEDVSYIGKIVAESLGKNIKESYIKTERVKINLNKKEVKAKKTTLILNAENQKELYKNLINDLKSDEKAKEIIIKYNPEFFNINVDEQLNGLMIEQDFNFAVYYKDITNKIVMMEFSGIPSNDKIVYTKGTEDTIEFISNNEVYSKMNFKIEKEKFIINGKSLGDSIITINGEKSDDGYIYDWNIISEDNTVTGKYILKYKTITKDTEYDVNKDFNIKVAEKGNELFSLGIIDNAKITNVVQINENIDNSVKITNLTEEDINQILMGLYSVVMQLMGS